jgi:hypothetical protein
MTKKIEIREGAPADLYIPESVEEMYCDGSSLVSLGWPISKLLFHTVVELDEENVSIEQRKANLRLAIPTHVLIALCEKVLEIAQKNPDTFEKNAQRQSDALASMLNKFSAPPSDA